MSTGQPVPPPQRALELAATLRWIFNQSRILRPRVHAACDLLEQQAAELETLWSTNHRLALELECLLLSTKDTAALSAWWNSAHDALELHRAAVRQLLEDKQ